MHPELLNNSLFLRYYNQWLKKPDSIVFASVADYLLIYGMVEEAINVCREGLKHSPGAVTGRLVLAKALMKVGNLDQAEDELDSVLEMMPSNTKALQLKGEIESQRRPAGTAASDPSASPQMTATVSASVSEVNDDGEQGDDDGDAVSLSTQDEDVPSSDDEMVRELPAWQTITMAKIYTSQGHQERAREIYSAILARDPSNEDAREGLSSLGGGA